jgi:soluble lytic murein transglycosylase
MEKSMKKFLLTLVLIAILAGAAHFLRSAITSIDEEIYPLEYTRFVEEQCEIYDVDKTLVYAVIHTESKFNPDAVSSIGARGLMQITKPTFEWAQMKLGKDFAEDTYDDMFDPETNIKYGTFLLSAFIEEFGSVDNALCAYHAGWGNAKNWLKDPKYSPDGENITNIPFKDTNWYVNKINEVMDKYQSLYFSEKE